MRIFTSFFCVLLVVGGVSGVERKKVTLSVMKGDTVTLNPDDAEIQTGDLILWRFEGSIIGKRLSDGSVSTDGDGRFKEKLLLDKQTGSLTITDLTTGHTGMYQLEIRSKTEIFKNYSVTVSDVVESVSVMEGDSVTLHTDVKVQGSDQIVWKFGDQGAIITNLNGAVDGGWRNTHQNEQTRDLTISSIRRNQSGAYKMEINTSSMILHKKFSINIIDGMKTVSVKEGEPVSLHTGLIELKDYDLILWTFENHLIARINRATNQFSITSAGGKFEGRLQRDLQTGSLIISGSRTTDSGYYHLNMSSSTHTLQKTITVTVTNVPVRDVPVTEGSGWKTAFIVVVSLVIIGFLIMIIYKKRICWKKGGAIPNPSSTELLGQ